MQPFPCLIFSIAISITPLPIVRPCRVKFHIKRIFICHCLLKINSKSIYWRTHRMFFFQQTMVPNSHKVGWGKFIQPVFVAEKNKTWSSHWQNWIEQMIQYFWASSSNTTLFANALYLIDDDVYYSKAYNSISRNMMLVKEGNTKLLAFVFGTPIVFSSSSHLASLGK